MSDAFSLFNFAWIEKFEHRVIRTAAAAGAAIAETIYTCQEGRIALFLDFHVNSVKATSTVFQLIASRIDAITKLGAIAGNEILLKETLGTNESILHWPMAKPSTNWSLGATFLFLFPGELITIAHALTAAETIVDTVGFTIIQYKDPRYGKR